MKKSLTHSSFTPDILKFSNSGNKFDQMFVFNKNLWKFFKTKKTDKLSVQPNTCSKIKNQYIKHENGKNRTYKQNHK